MAVVSEITTEKQDNPWNGERPGQDTKKWKKNYYYLYIEE